MRLRFCSFVVGISLTLIVSQEPMRAMCQMLPGGSQAYFDESTMVFLGRATAVDFSIPRNKLPETTFEVEEIWKGTPQTVIRVLSSHSDSEGFVFAVGRRYVVFAYGNPLATSACTLTNEVDANRPNGVLQWLAMKPSQRPSDKALELAPR